MQSNEHLPIGYRIGGHYEIVKILGQGGFGIVYLVKDIHRLDALFVIKELFSKDFSYRYRDGRSVYNKAEARNIFEKIKADIISEVNILRKIRNKNIVEAYGYFEENNTIYSVMEFIDGIDLNKFLKNRPPFTQEEAKDLLLQISNGIKEIHSLNILHRDIKPSNIMRTRDGVYKIIDFTTNKTYVDNKMTTVTAFQSPIYTPPELSGTKRSIIGKFSDIYSIGMTICRTLAEDEEIFPNITDRLIDDSEFQNILKNLPIDNKFRAVLKKMTAINPEDRYQSLEEVEKDLLGKKRVDRTKERDKEENRPRVRVKKDRKETKSNSSPMFAIFGVVLSILVGSLGWYAYTLINKKEKKTQQQNGTTAVAKTDVEIPFHRPTKDDVKEVPTPRPTVVETNTPTIEDILEEDDDIEIIDTPTPTPSPKLIPTQTPPIIDQTPIPTPTPKPTNSNIEIVYQPTPRPTPKRHISLGIPVQTQNNRLGHLVQSGTEFNRQNIQNFLNQIIIASEENDIDKILSFYDTHVDRYFSLRNVTHRDIYRDKVRYSRKWVHREYGLIDFKILRKFTQNGVEYCDIEKTGNYRVVSSRGRVASGISKVFMRLKKTPYGFKIKSIYSIK
jgi:serine/threonine protein kinase